jgi:hypothetical protein
MNNDTIQQLLSNPRLWPSPDPTTDAVVSATRQCAPLFWDAAQCYATLGGDSPKCHLKFFNAHGCLGSFLHTDRLESLRGCVAAHGGDMTDCLEEANALKKANDDTFDAYARDELKLNRDEAKAWKDCGSLAFATNEDHSNLIAYCSMQAASPREFSTWMNCLGRHENNVNQCEEETRALLKGFRVYLEKTYIKDPTFFMRVEMKAEKSHF